MLAKKIRYFRTLVAARDSSDGETPTTLYVTKERNGFAMFIHDPDEGTRLIEWEPYSLNALIERAVRYGEEAHAEKGRTE